MKHHPQMNTPFQKNMQLIVTVQFNTKEMLGPAFVIG